MVDIDEIEAELDEIDPQGQGSLGCEEVRSRVREIGNMSLALATEPLHRRERVVDRLHEVATSLLAITFTDCIEDADAARESIQSLEETLSERDVTPAAVQEATDRYVGAFDAFVEQQVQVPGVSCVSASSTSELEEELGEEMLRDGIRPYQLSLTGSGGREKLYACLLYD